MAEDDGRGGFACRASIGDILLIGEQLRIQMHTDNPHLIKDRRYRLKIQSCCFVGSEAVDWLLATGQVPDRELAVLLLNILRENHIIKHVTNEVAPFMDTSQYYRFRKDDGTFPYCEDSNIFLRGQRLYNKLYNECCGDVLRTQEEGKSSYRNAFLGSELVSWMLEHKEATSRDDAIKILRKLLQSDVIRHVSDKHHFKDESLLYQFKIDFGRPRILLDLVLPPPEAFNGPLPHQEKSAAVKCLSEDSSSKSSPSTAQDIPGSHSSNSLRAPYRTESGYHSDQADGSNSSPCPDASPELFSPRVGGMDEFSSSCDSIIFMPSNGMLIRSATTEELEDHNGSYSQKHIHIASDPVGFGFVIRGEGPCYVKTVDPTGPAANAGLRVGHFIHSVNDQKVLGLHHQDLAHVILANMDNLNLVVMIHHKDRRK